jgi:CyaY protein
MRAKVITQLVMDEKAYRNLVDATLAHIDSAFADVDPDLAECSISQGALTILFPGGLRAIVSPQPPVRQMWLAFKDRGYHFDWDGARWRDDKGAGLELYALVAEITRATSGVAVDL